jgi:hypothetical protein
VEEDTFVKIGLLLTLCSNFVIVDSKNFVQLAHLSVREYLEGKSVEGCFIYSPEKIHAQAAIICIAYWNFAHHKISKPIKSEGTSESDRQSDPRSASLLGKIPPGSMAGPRSRTTIRHRERNIERNPSFINLNQTNRGPGKDESSNLNQKFITVRQMVHTRDLRTMRRSTGQNIVKPRGNYMC